MRSDIVSNFETYLMALLGGVLIGVGSAVATAATGRIPGVSGVLGRLLRPSAGDLSWRILFLIGLIGGAATAFGLVTSASAFSFVRPFVDRGPCWSAGRLRNTVVRRLYERSRCLRYWPWSWRLAVGHSHLCGGRHSYGTREPFSMTRAFLVIIAGFSFGFGLVYLGHD